MKRRVTKYMRDASDLPGRMWPNAVRTMPDNSLRIFAEAAEHHDKPSSPIDKWVCAYQKRPMCGNTPVKFVIFHGTRCALCQKHYEKYKARNKIPGLIAWEEA